jgi:Phosphate-selective porin O and P
MKIQGLLLLAGAALSLGGQAALAQQSSDEVRAVVAEMLSDAETRTSLLNAGDAGHDGKFFIAGNGFRLNVGGQIQFRYTLNFRDDDAAGVNDDFDANFQTRRTRLITDGKINEDWDFRVQGEFNKSGGNFGLQDAFVRYNAPNGIQLKWGQFKLPLLREEGVSDSYLLAAERSIVNEVFSQKWSQGVEVAYEAEEWRAAIAFSDGLNSLNTDIGANQPTGLFTFRNSGAGDYAITARGEFLFAGSFAQFKDHTSPKGADYGALLGAAIHWQESKNTNNPIDIDRDLLQYTVDLSVKGDSWALFGAFVGRYMEDRNFSSKQKYNDFGGVVQGSWRFAEDTEVFARWDALFLDSDWIAGGDDNFNFITAGFNHYFAGHAAKFTVDVVYSVDETNNLQSIGALPDTGVGILGQSETGEVALRGQFQLLF